MSDETLVDFTSDASQTDSIVIERHTQYLPMADMLPWLEQLKSAQTKQQKMPMEEQAKQQKILEESSSGKIDKSDNACHACFLLSKLTSF